MSGKKTVKDSKQPVRPVPEKALASDTALVTRTTNVASQMVARASDLSASTSAEIVSRSRATGRAIGAAAAGVTKASGAIAIGAARLAKSTAHHAMDLNGDGKVDERDLQLAKAAAAHFGNEVADLGKSVLRHDITRDAAAGAAVGALIAVPIPFVGPAVGAAIGAAAGMARGVLAAPASESLAGEVVSRGMDGVSAIVDSARAKPRTPARKKKSLPKT